MEHAWINGELTVKVVESELVPEQRLTVWIYSHPACLH